MIDSTLQQRVERQRVAMLYGNTLAVSSSAVLMTALIAVIAWPHAPTLNLSTWCAAVLLVQMYVQYLARAYRQAPDRDANPQFWAWRLARAAAAAGVVWGAAVFVLVGPQESLTLALISACLAGRATISVMTHAYFPPALHSFAVPIFGLLTLRYMTLGGYGNAALGVMWIAVLGYVLLFVDRQARAVSTQIRLRYENEQLIEKLQQQNELAEQARARAEEASRAKSLFFAAANHDLRQPLHSLGLFATALRNGNVDPALRRHIDQILQCTDSLEQLFDNLLDISKLDAGQVTARKEVVSADAVLDRLRSTFVEQAQEKGLKLTVRRSSAMISTDPTLLFRVLSNLIANAIRYTEYGGVLVACRRRAGRARFEVWDSGVGIPADEHERIFEEFYQLNNPARARARGLGLGLATVRRIVRLLDHPLQLTSTPGQGSRFVLEAPLADPATITAVSVTAEQKIPNLIRGKLILVIDDEESVRLGMISLLESWGCRGVAAEDAQGAIAALRERIPDFIVADLRLRGGATGVDVIRDLRHALGEPVPAVLISGDTAPEQLRKVSAAGLTMMHKPLKPVRLRALLNHEFARQREAEALS